MKIKIQFHRKERKLKNHRSRTPKRRIQGTGQDSRPDKPIGTKKIPSSIKEPEGDEKRESEGKSFQESLKAHTSHPIKYVNQGKSREKAQGARSINDHEKNNYFEAIKKNPDTKLGESV